MGELPETRRLPLDARALRGEGRLRLFAALLSIPAAVWLLAVTRTWLLWILGLLALLFGTLWVRRFRAMETSGLDPCSNYLELTPEGVMVVEEGRARGATWRNAGDISIDQDALVVCVARGDGSELRIEPQYGALGLQKLAETIYEYAQRAKACTGAQDD